jgi:hypothetical protein
MSRLALSLLVVFLTSVVLCATDAVDEVEVQLGTFEGSYSLSTGGSLYLCQDGTSVQGSYNDLGLIRGGVAGSTLTGNFWAAGTGPCVLGTAKLTLVDFGVKGNLTCNDGVNNVGIVATKVSSYRPTDSQCGLVAESGSTVQGRWVTSNQKYELNICFIDSPAVNYTAEGSLQRVDPDGNVLDWFFSGFWVDGGRIFLGTWYQDFSAGAILFFVNNNEDIELFFWTGLIYDQGQTFIDLNQLYNPYLHGREAYQRPPGPESEHSTSASLCEKNRQLQRLVLSNLPREAQADNYYYFIDVAYLDDIQNIRPFVSESSSASLALCFVTLMLSVVVALF